MNQPNPPTPDSPDDSADEATVVGGEARAAQARGPVERTIGPFLLLERLGRGGQGEVFRARDQRLGRVVALKILNQFLGFGDDMTRAVIRARFEREAEIAARIGHPGVCPIFEFGEEAGLPWIAMQLVEGDSLDQRLKRRREAITSESPPPWPSIIDAESDEITTRGRSSGSTSLPSRSRSEGSGAVDRQELVVLVEFFEQAARALHAAHQAGLIHRDIKPGNLMVTKEGRPVILDFGLARDTSGESKQSDLTMTGEIMGTPAYMSPEQFIGDHQNIDARTDVYALGVALFESLTLVRPFQAATREALREQVLHEDSPDPRRLNPAVSKDLAIVVGCALEKNPDRRYASAEAFAEDLRRIRELKPIAARPIGPGLKFYRWIQRNPVVATMTASLFLLLAIVAAVFYFKSAELSAANRNLAESNTKLEEKTAEAETNLTKAREEARAKAAALMEYQRMADTRRLANAHRDAEALWPPSPALVVPLQAWQDRYGALFQRLPDHRRALQALKAEAISDGGTDQSPDFGGDADLEFRFATLEKLVRDLESAVQDETSLRANIALRLDLSHRIEAETLTAVAKTWERAAERVTMHPDYKGLKLKPQLGLIPLGPDPVSGLEEFLHWQSHAGDLPKRNAEGIIERNDDTGIIFVLIPGGDFTMGAQNGGPDQPNYDPEATPNEDPPQLVKLDAYLLSKYEMTQSQWQRANGDWPSNFRPGYDKVAVAKPITALNPVERVSWEQSQEVMRRLGILLPTEAQWEYAARAGTTFRFSGTKDRENLAEFANLLGVEASRYFPNYDRDHEDPFMLHVETGSLKPNAFGLHDMTGNVEEWCREATAEYSKYPARDGDGFRESEKTGHMARGASFNSRVTAGRLTNRVNYALNNKAGTCGLRPSRALE